MKHWPVQTLDTDYRSGVVMAIQRHAFQAAEKAGHLVTLTGDVATIIFCGSTKRIEYGSAVVIDLPIFERAVLHWASETVEAFLREDSDVARLSNSAIEAARAISVGDWLAVPVRLDDDQLLRILETAAMVAPIEHESSKFA